MPPHPTRPLTVYERFHLRPSLLQNDVTSTPTGVTINLKTTNRCAFCFQILKLTYTIKTKTKKAQTGHIESHIFLNFVGMKMDIDQIKQTIYDIVVCIPEGCVTTYSDVARFAGMPNHARVVGKILRETPQDLAIPCHRVVGSEAGWPRNHQTNANYSKRRACLSLKAGVSICAMPIGITTR